MEWTTKYIIGRPSPEGEVKVVYTVDSLKDARHWLQYHGDPKDALFLAPISKESAVDAQPKYTAHLVQRGQIEYNVVAWYKQAFKVPNSTKCYFVNAVDSVQSKAENRDESSKTTLTQDELLELLDGRPKNISLEKLQQVAALPTENLRIILTEPMKWIDWESPMRLMAQDVYVTEVDLDSEWPLKVSFKPEEGKGDTMSYDSGMEFLIKAVTS